MQKSLSHVVAALLCFQMYTYRVQMMVKACIPNPVFLTEVSTYNLYHPTPIHKINSFTLIANNYLGCGKLYNYKLGLNNH